jgi:hypothetical protein
LKNIEVHCPNCKKKFLYSDSNFRPFCSEKCRLIDLGQWLNESYSVPAQKLTPEEVQDIERLYEDEKES